MDQFKKRYDSYLCLEDSAVAELKAEEPLEVVVVNVGTTPKLLLPKQHIAEASPHPATLIELHISHAEL